MGTLLPLALLGAATGLAASVLHQSPLWLVVGALAGLATVVALPARLRLVWGAGFALPVLVLSWPRAAGDVLLTGNASLLLACQAALWVGVGLAGLLGPTRTTQHPARGPVGRQPPAGS